MMENSGRDSEFTKEATRLKKLQADRIEIELQEDIGKVLHIESFVSVLCFHNSQQRSRLLGLAHKLKSMIPYLQTRDVARIDDEVRAMLTELANIRLPKEIMGRVAEIERAGWGDVRTGLVDVPPEGEKRPSRSIAPDRYKSLSPAPASVPATS